MSIAELVPALVTPEEYLAAEAQADQKHEYIGGVVYAMAGGKNRHHLIATNALVSLGTQLRGRTCRVFNSDTKVRIRLPSHTRFYYPDAQVVCRPSPPEQVFQDEPVVVIEVVSESTRRTDEQEKREGYLSIGSLGAYVLLEQDRAAATVWRRASSGFRVERYTGLEASIPLPDVEATLPLAEVYESVAFPNPESPDEEGAS